jgi:hypothetical protein
MSIFPKVGQRFVYAFLTGIAYTGLKELSGLSQQDSKLAIKFLLQLHVQSEYYKWP